MVFDIATLDRVAADLGTPVPNGDPDKIFALADQIEASAQKWDGNADELARLRLRLRSALAGDTAEAHDQHLAALLNGPDSLQGDSEAVRAGVAALRNYGADLQDNQWTSRLLAAWLLATMIWGAASVIATGGESLVEVAVARVRTAVALNALKEVLWQRIAGILTELLVNAGKGMLLGGAEQLVVQGVQVAMGERTGLNGQLIAGTGLSFAEFGAGAEAAEHSVLGLVGDAANDSRAGSVAAWATSKVLSGMAGNTVATAASGGPITPETLGVGAALGAAGALGDARGKGAPAVDTKPTGNDNAVAANAINTHPTLRFEKQPDGSFAWPGETINDAGPHADIRPAPALTAEPATAAGEHSAGTASHALPAAADPGARPVETTTTTAPAATETAHQPGTSVTASLDPSPTARAALGSHLSEGTLDLSTASPAAHTGPLTATASPTAPGPPPPTNAVSPATPTMPNAAPPAPTPTVPSAAGPPSPAPTVPSAAGPPSPAPTSPSASPGPTAGLSSPTPGPHAGPAEISPASTLSPEPAGAPAAGRVDTTATPDPGVHDTPVEQAASAQAVGVDPAAPAGRSAADAHLLGRSEGTRAESGRASDPLTTRRDPARPDSTRDDSNRPGGARPGKLPRRSGVARDVPQDLQPAAATRAPDPLAAAQDIGVIKASYGDSGPGPGEPEPHRGGRDISDGQNSPGPGTAGGGAGDSRGGAGGHRGGAGGGAGDGGARPGDGGQSDDEDPAREVNETSQDALAGSHGPIHDVAVLAGEVLAQRVSLVADELVPREYSAVLTVEWARDNAVPIASWVRDNAVWWAGLSDAERHAVIEIYPKEIGNAEGVLPQARHEANTRVLEQRLADRDQLQQRADRGQRLTKTERRDLQRFNRLEEAWRKAGIAGSSSRTGWFKVHGPLLLAFDPDAFGGRGRAIVSFGADPYRADSVSWGFPGKGVTLDDLDVVMGEAQYHLRSTQRAEPGSAATSIAWIGHDMTTKNAVRDSPSALVREMIAFSAARDAWAGDGSHFSANRDFKVSGDPLALRSKQLEQNAIMFEEEREAKAEAGEVQDPAGPNRGSVDESRSPDPGNPSHIPGSGPHDTAEPAGERGAGAVIDAGSGPGSHGPIHDVAVLAGEVLAQRVSLVADELVPREYSAVLTVEWARDNAVPIASWVRDNAVWWAGLSDAERHAVIEIYPKEIGNAEGVLPQARHEANTRVLEQRLADRDQLQQRADRGQRLTKTERRDLQRFNRLEEAWRKAGIAGSSSRTGWFKVHGPLLLAFDPDAFGGRGRAIVSFGADPYRADSVSWGFPGKGVTLDDLDVVMGEAQYHLRSTQRAEPGSAATSIAWIGHDMTTKNAVREGESALRDERRAFNAARDAWAGDGSHFSAHRDFAISGDPYALRTKQLEQNAIMFAEERAAKTETGDTGGGLGFVAEFGRNDEPIYPLAHVTPSSECLTDYETNRAQHWSRFAADRKLSLDHFIAQADDHAAELVRNSYVCTRVTGPTLQKVLDSGELKSFFDTGETSIFDHQLEEYVPSHKALFGYGADLAPEARPIYGYLTRDPLGRDLYGGRLSGYGTAAVVFKPQVAERTTITLNDSLAVATHNDEMKVGMSFADPLTNPTSNLFRRNEDPFTYQNPESVRPYIEAQIHRLTSTPSGTELSPLRTDSIDRVTFLSDRSEYPPELFDTLDSRGIPYSFSQDPPAEPTIAVDADFV